jgi:hypothetical protein
VKWGECKQVRRFQRQGAMQRYLKSLSFQVYTERAGVSELLRVANPSPDLGHGPPWAAVNLILQEMRLRNPEWLQLLQTAKYRCKHGIAMGG